MEKISIIIINWNSTSDTLKCIESIAGNHNIIVVDNGSSPIQAEQLKNNLSNDITLITNDKNYGFAKANNQGIQYAIKHFNPKFIMLLNSDTKTTENLISTLVSTIQSDPLIAAVQPKILKMTTSSNGTPIIDSAGHIAYPWGSIRDMGLGKKDSPLFNVRREIFGACAAVCIYRVSSLLKIGCFDERLFTLFEDVDLSLRLRQKGYKIVYEPKALSYHKRGVSGKINEKNIVLRKFYGFRNCILINIKYYPLIYIIIFFPIHSYRLLTAVYFKSRYKIKDPFFKLIKVFFRERFEK